MGGGSSRRQVLRGAQRAWDACPWTVCGWREELRAHLRGHHPLEHRAKLQQSRPDCQLCADWLHCWRRAASESQLLQTSGRSEAILAALPTFLLCSSFLSLADHSAVNRRRPAGRAFVSVATLLLHSSGYWFTEDRQDLKGIDGARRACRRRRRMRIIGLMSAAVARIRAPAPSHGRERAMLQCSVSQHTLRAPPAFVRAAFRCSGAAHTITGARMLDAQKSCLFHHSVTAPFHTGIGLSTTNRRLGWAAAFQCCWGVVRLNAAQCPLTAYRTERTSSATRMPCLKHMR